MIHEIPGAAAPLPVPAHAPRPAESETAAIEPYADTADTVELSSAAFAMAELATALVDEGSGLLQGMGLDPARLGLAVGEDGDLVAGALPEDGMEREQTLMALTMLNRSMRMHDDPRYHDDAMLGASGLERMRALRYRFDAAAASSESWSG